MEKQNLPKIIKYNNENAYLTKYYGYYATKSGKVLSCKVKGGQGRIDINNPRELISKYDKDGYIECTISINGKNRYIKAHKIIYETFNGDIPEGMTVDHKDNIKTHNELSNLQLLSRGDNTRKAKSGKPSNKKKYEISIDGKLQGIYEKKELKEKFDINNHDISTFINKGKYTSKLIERKITLKRV